MKKRIIFILFAFLILILILSTFLYFSKRNESNVNYSLDIKFGDLTIGDYVQLELDNKTLSEETINYLNQYSGLHEMTEMSNANYLDENPIAQENLKWRILSIKDGKYTLISDCPTDSRIFLYGYNGYNNAVLLLNNICNDLYTSKFGISRSLNLDDVDDFLSYNYTSLKNYNKQVNLIRNINNLNYFPNILSDENYSNKVGSQNEIITGSTISKNTTLDVYNTSWNIKLGKDDFVNDVYYDLFTNFNHSKDYILATRSVNAIENINAEFSLYSFNITSDLSQKYFGDNVGLYNSNNNMSSCYYSFRPVIDLNNNVDIKPCVGENSETNPHTLYFK